MAPSFLPAGARAALIDERARWVSASCIEMLGSDVAVTIDLPHEPDEDVARALARALVPAETEVAAPGRALISFALLAGVGSLGLSVEGWYLARLSALAQLEAIDSGAEENGRGRSPPARPRGSVPAPRVRAGAPPSTPASGSRARR